MAMPFDRLSKRQLRDRRAWQRAARQGIINVTGTGLTYDPDTNTLENTVTASVGTPMWTRYVIAETAFVGVTDTETVDVATMGAAEVVHAVQIKTLSRWLIGGVPIGTSLCNIGSGAYDDLFVLNYNVQEVVAADNFVVSTNNCPYSESYDGSWKVRMTLNVTSKATGDLTEGEVEVWLLTSTPDATIPLG